jgi:hypothetical protein
MKAARSAPAGSPPALLGTAAAMATAAATAAAAAAGLFTGTIAEADKLLLNIASYARTRPSALRRADEDVEFITTALHRWIEKVTAEQLRNPPADGKIGTSRFKAITIADYSKLKTDIAGLDFTTPQARLNTLQGWLGRMFLAASGKLPTAEGQSAADYLTEALLCHVKAFSMFRDFHFKKRPAEGTNPRPTTRNRH